MKIYHASICLIAFFVIAGCSERKASPQPPPGVIVTEVKYADIRDSATVVGQVKAYKSVKLVARVKGFLRKKNFIEGQIVKKGQLLFLIEQEQYKADVKSAEGTLLKALADQKNSNIDYLRQKTLYEKKAVSQRMYDDASAKKMKADAGVLTAQANLSMAKINLSYTEVFAPFNGRIGLVTYNIGNVVGPSSEQLADVVMLNPVRVQFNLSEVDLLDVIRKHNKDRRKEIPLVVNIVFQDGSKYGHEGSITFWNNQINPTTGTLLMQATFKNDDNLLVAGMYVKVVLTGKTAKKALVVPRNAILENLSGKYVMMVNKANEVVRREVVTGIEENLVVEVKTGLKEGDLIIVDGLQKVRPGLTVAPKLDNSYLDKIPAAVGGAAGKDNVAEDVKVKLPEDATTKSKGKTKSETGKGSKK